MESPLDVSFSLWNENLFNSAPVRFIVKRSQKPEISIDIESFSAREASLRKLFLSAESQKATLEKLQHFEISNDKSEPRIGE